MEQPRSPRGPAVYRWDGETEFGLKYPKRGDWFGVRVNQSHWLKLPFHFESNHLTNSVSSDERAAPNNPHK